MYNKLFFIILTIVIVACKSKENSMNTPTVFDTVDPKTSDRLKIEHITIKDKTVELIVPIEEVFKDKLYDEEQAKRIIHLNLGTEIKKKISPSRLLKLIQFQGDFIEAKDAKHQNYLDDSRENTAFLKQKMKSTGIDLNLSDQEINDIIRIDSYYMELINYTLE